MPITFEEAIDKALSIDDSLNICYEYKVAYHFFDTRKSDTIGDAGIVILKETGKEIPFLTFLFDYHPETRYKTRPLFPKKKR